MKLYASLLIVKFSLLNKLKFLKLISRLLIKQKKKNDQQINVKKNGSVATQNVGYVQFLLTQDKTIYPVNNIENFY
jgi:hypothetical protein